MSKKDLEMIKKSERIEGTGPLIGSLGIRTLTEAEKRKLRDTYLKESG